MSFDIGPVNVHAVRYAIENALVAEKLNLPLVTVNTKSVEFQWCHLVDLELKGMDEAEVEIASSLQRCSLLSYLQPNDLVFHQVFTSSYSSSSGELT